MKRLVPLVALLSLGWAGCSSRPPAGAPKNAAQEVTQAAQDAVTTGRVKTVLANMKGVDASKVNVDTAGGVVTLTGTVSPPADVATITATVRKVDGVKDVRNQLTVAPASPKEP